MPGPLHSSKYGTLRCGICSINYPRLDRFKECPVCSVATAFFSNLQVDEDWLDLAESMAKVIDGDIPETPPQPL